MSLPIPPPRASKTAPKVRIGPFSPAEVSEWGTEEHIERALELAAEIGDGMKGCAAVGNSDLRKALSGVREKVEEMTSHLRSAL